MPQKKPARYVFARFILGLSDILMVILMALGVAVFFVDFLPAFFNFGAGGRVGAPAAGLSLFVIGVLGLGMNQFFHAMIDSAAAARDTEDLLRDRLETLPAEIAVALRTAGVRLEDPAGSKPRTSPLAARHDHAETPPSIAPPLGPAVGE